MDNAKTITSAVIGDEEAAKQVSNEWASYGNKLIVGDIKFSFFKKHILAIKELLQNGAVAGGDNSECLVKIYQDDKGKYHLLVANTADEPADLKQMMDFNNSQHESISNLNGEGTKDALSAMYGKKRGSFKIATRYNDGRIGYKESPYGSYMPIKEDFTWPIDAKYRTYVDTEISGFEKLKDILSIDALNRDLGALFGFRLERGMKLRLEVLDDVIEEVKADLPLEISEKNELKWDRKKNPETDAPDLIINHSQSATREILRKNENGEEYVTTVSFTAEDRESKKSTGMWAKKMMNQGAWVVVDGVIQAYLGTEIFGLREHPSMNGKFTFIEFTDVRNGGFNDDEPMFNSSKTAINQANDVIADLFEYFDTPEPELAGNSGKMNSISEGYRWASEVDTEKRVREHRDLIYELYGLKETENGNPTRYVKEFENGKGSIYDGVIIRDTEQGGKIDTIIEYKKSPATIEDVDQILRYIKQELDKGNVIRHLVLSAPTIREDAFAWLEKEIARHGDERYLEAVGNITIYLFNDEYDRSENETYSKRKLNSFIDQETFDRLKNTNEYWQIEDENKDKKVTKTEIEYNQRYSIYGSAPISYLYAEKIMDLKRQNELMELQWKFEGMKSEELKAEMENLTQKFQKLPFTEQIGEQGAILAKKINDINKYLSLGNKSNNKNIDDQYR